MLPPGNFSLPAGFPQRCAPSTNSIPLPLAPSLCEVFGRVTACPVAATCSRGKIVLLV